ncbi:MAG: hypothetical protein DWI24_02680 [Planctomycetota bacterium]|nr:MAG: hypothetical protein DWI24_02680 [Planctomycetota bacterium]
MRKPHRPIKIRPIWNLENVISTKKTAFRSPRSMITSHLNLICYNIIYKPSDESLPRLAIWA